MSEPVPDGRDEAKTPLPGTGPLPRRFGPRMVIVVGAGMFVLGGLLGSYAALTMSSHHRRDVMRHPERVRGRFVDVLEEELSLSDEQRAAASAVIEANHSRMLEQRTIEMDAMDAAIAALLDPAQAERWKAMIAERETRFHVGPPPGHGGAPPGLPPGPPPRGSHPHDGPRPDGPPPSTSQPASD